MTSVTPCVTDKELEYCIHPECIQFADEIPYDLEDFDFQDIDDIVYGFDHRDT